MSNRYLVQRPKNRKNDFQMPVFVPQNIRYGYLFVMCKIQIINE